VVQVNPRTHESGLSVEVARCLPGPEAQADEQWSFVRHKKNQRWLWYAIDSAIGRVLAFVFGRRTDEVCRSLLEKLAVFNVARYFTDGWGSYSKLIPPDKHVVGKRHTQRIATDREQEPVVQDEDQAPGPQDPLLFQVRNYA
jgi:IS1 family transposase